MKNEIMKAFKEKPREAVITCAMIGIIGLGLIELYGKSQNQLTYAKNFMADPVAQAEMCSPEELLPGQYFTNVCDVIKDVTICDGKNTMFDFSDDVCETLPQYIVYSQDYIALNEGLGR